MQSLFGHTSPETAHIVHDYPFGSNLRCIKRWWVQTTKSGMRVCSQTTAKDWNRVYTSKLPDQMEAPEGTSDGASTYWNNSKKSTYSDIRVLYLDENGHVQNTGISVSSWPKHFYDFDKTVGELPPELKEIRNVLEARSRAYSSPSWLRYENEVLEGIER